MGVYIFHFSPWRVKGRNFNPFACLTEINYETLKYRLAGIGPLVNGLSVDGTTGAKFCPEPGIYLLHHGIQPCP